MLIVLAVAFFYSSGMPILYPIAAIFFVITYCTDKWLLFHYYKQPPMYNSYLARKTLKWFKYIILLHIVGAVFMFSNSSILPYSGKLKEEMTLEE